MNAECVILVNVAVDLLRRDLDPAHHRREQRGGGQQHDGVGCRFHCCFEPTEMTRVGWSEDVDKEQTQDDTGTGQDTKKDSKGSREPTKSPKFLGLLIPSPLFLSS